MDKVQWCGLLMGLIDFGKKLNITKVQEFIEVKVIADTGCV